MTIAAAPARRLRLAFMIEHVNRTGGQERVAAELATRLSRRHEVHLYSFRVEGVPPEVIVHRLWEPPVGSSTGRALAYIWLAQRALRGQHYDAVIAQGGNCLTPDFVLMHICQEERRRAVIRVAPRSLSGALSQRLFGWRQGITSRLERRAILRCPGRVAAVSPALARSLCEIHGLPPGSIVPIPNGVDLDQFQPEVRTRLRAPLRQELGLRPEDFAALFVGGRWVEKGLGETITGLAKMQQPGQLLVVGRGDEAAFGRQAQQLGVGERVRFLGVQGEIERFYAAADCLVFTPPAEGFGLVMAEAAACGLPLVATRTGIAEYLIEPEESGYLVSLDPGEIGAALDALAADPERRERMGQAAYARARTLTWDREAELFEQFLLERLPAGREV